MSIFTDDAWKLTMKPAFAALIPKAIGLNDSFALILLMRGSILCISLLALLLMPAGTLLESNNIQPIINSYNSQIEGAPQLLKMLLGSEVIEIDVLLSNGTSDKLEMKTENAEITRVAYGDFEKPTISIYTTEGTILKIWTAEDRITVFQEEKDAGNITIRGNTFTASIKLGLLMPSMDVLRFLAGLLPQA
jgi:hypothetical protein